MDPLVFPATGALFDMDGTLVDSTAVVEATWRDFCREHGVDAHGLVPWSHGGRTSAPVRHFLPDVSESRLAAIVADFEQREQSTMAGIVEIPGAQDLLAGIEIPWAVVTSAPRELAV